MSFVPDDFDIPSGTQTEHLTLRMLAPDVTALDYDALMESRVRLRLWSDGTWPEDDFTLDGNRGDLEEHEREFHAREAFAYTVLSPDEARCEGCIYINPLARFLNGQTHRRDCFVNRLRRTHSGSQLLGAGYGAGSRHRRRTAGWSDAVATP